MKTLYICYFGVNEPLVQTQVLPYLRELQKGGIAVHVLTFEPAHAKSRSPTQAHQIRERLNEQGLRWHWLPYHKRPSALATLYDIVAGACFAARLVLREHVDVLHARSHVPLAMGLLVRRLTGCKLIFDFRGLLAEEYVDAGIWKEGGALYQAAKRVEREGFSRADHIVVLAEKMRGYIVERKWADTNRIEVIPCCVDSDRFETARNDQSQLENTAPYELIYAGSVTGLYLLEEMGRFYVALKRRVPSARFRILTGTPAVEVQRVLLRVGIGNGDTIICAATPDEIPSHLARARLAISFRKSTFSQLAASPAKIAEYLVAGLPVVSNAGVGDMDRLMEESEVGVVLRDFREATFRSAVDRVVELAASGDVRARCFRIAKEHFDLGSVGGARYRKVYERLEGNSYRAGIFRLQKQTKREGSADREGPEHLCSVTSGGEKSRAEGGSTEVPPREGLPRGWSSHRGPYSSRGALDGSSLIGRFREWVRAHNYDIGVRYFPVAHAIRQADSDGRWRVLDVGSGSRGIAPYLSGRFVVGMDPEMPASVRHPFVEGTVLRLPFRDRSWDAVVCVDVLEHLSISDRELALAELIRVTGKLLIIAYPFGPRARDADLEFAAAYSSCGKTPPTWLTEHLQNPYPEHDLLARLRYAAGAKGLTLETRFNESLALQRSHRFLARTFLPGYVLWSLLCGLALPLLARRLSPDRAYRCISIVWRQGRELRGA